MKRISPKFFSGIAAAFLFISLIGSAAAASTDVAYNRVGITAFGKTKVTAGESFTAPNGQKVPTSITYTDAAGGKTNYLSIRQLSELLDAQISWNDKTGAVEIAPGCTGSTTIYIPEKNQVDNPKPVPDDVTVVTGEPDSSSATPVYGTVAGAFCEVDPKAVNLPSSPAMTVLSKTHVQSDSVGFPDTSSFFSPEIGKYVVFTVTNNGTTTQNVTVYRNITISDGGKERFTTVAIAPGQTLVRVFEIEKDAEPLGSVLTFGMYPTPITGSTNVTVSLVQYA